jgi:triosephosphate isomerase (TIM)
VFTNTERDFSICEGLRFGNERMLTRQLSSRGDRSLPSNFDHSFVLLSHSTLLPRSVLLVISLVLIPYQACYPKDAGAFTGAISATQLKSLGVSWALAGHSERRVIFGETDEDINSQCLNLIEKGMSVMLCIGESEAEYDLKLAGAVCEVQLKKGLAGIPKEKVATKVAIAYEPVWAIGTGKVATPAVAQSVHAAIRSILTEMYDEETADAIRVLYGGSVTPESVDDLMKEPDIDGALVGGASLDATKFARIMNFQV